MTRYKNKDELVKSIQAERRRLEKVLISLTGDDMVAGGVVGAWTVKDILVHLTAWEQLFLNWYNAGLHNKPSSPDPVGMSKKKIDALNKDIFLRNQNSPLPEVLDQFHGSYRQILTAVQQIDEKEMFVPGYYTWTGKLSLADYIAGNTCNHYYWAKTKIRNWIKMQRC